MTPNATKQAPDTPSAAADGDTEVQRKAIAKREWLGSDGAPVDDESNGVAARYTFLEDGKSYTFTPTTDDARTRMLSIFGALTLMGNVTNTWKGEKNDRADSPIDAIAERFSLMETGQWIDRTGAVGAKIDKDVLAEAMTQCAITAGKVDGDDAAAVGAKKAEYREKLESADFVRTVRKVPAINSKYAELVGQTVKTLDEVL